MSTSSVPARLRQQLDRWAETWLQTKFSRLLELRAQDPRPFNYPIAVFSEWRGKAFYLNVRYRARSRRPEDDFVVRHTRMTLTGFGRFDLAYFRHTDEYLAGLSPEDQAALQKVRRAIHAAAPGAEECTSYGMPAFRLDGKLIAGFKAAANHCSFHPMNGETVATLKADLAGYDTSRGTIRFSAGAGLPATLVRKLVKARIAEG